MRRSFRVAATLVLIVTACSGGRNNHEEPLSDPDCADSTVRATVAAPDGVTLTVSETSTNQWFCLSDGQTVGLDSTPGESARLTDQGSLMHGGMYSLFVVPADTPLAARLVNDTGEQIPFAQTGDGDHVLILDVSAPPPGPQQGKPVTFTLLAADGTDLLTLHGFR